MSSRIRNEQMHGEQIAANAEEVWNWDSPAGKHRAERRAQYFADLGDFSTEHQLLEIGCGTGLFTEKMFSKTGAQITAIDISDALLKQAVAKVPAARFIIQDAMNTNFPDENFDGIYGSSVIHHLDEQKVWDEMYRLLKPGGKLIFAEPNMLNPQIFVQKNVPFIKKWLGDSPDETAIVRWKTRKRLLQTGFTSVKVFPYDFLHPITPSFLIKPVQQFGKLIEQIPVLKEIAGSVIIYAEKN
jgi:ubiquinone/menaquinone biosynthesis C-methylase UbiE